MRFNIQIFVKKIKGNKTKHAYDYSKTLKNPTLTVQSEIVRYTSMQMYEIKIIILSKYKKYMFLEI